MHRSLSRRTYIVFASLALSLAASFFACTTSRHYPRTNNDRRSNHQPNLLNINRATASELAKVPRIGPSLARKIIEHRERYGPFLSVEQLLLIDGISENRFRELSPFLTVD